jgi:tetratricopeptide (TPR) repeat protein
MKPVRSFLFLVPLVLLASGCANTRAAHLRADVRTFQREQSAEKLTARGRAFAQLGDTTRAREYFDAALEAGGDERELVPLLLSVCVRDGRFRLAVDYARRFVVEHPDDGRMRFVLGTLYAALGEAATAKEQLVLALEANPKNADAQYALAVLLRDQHSDPVQADVHFRAYLRLLPNGEHAAEAQGSLIEKVP